SIGPEAGFREPLRPEDNHTPCTPRPVNIPENPMDWPEELLAGGIVETHVAQQCVGSLRRTGQARIGFRHLRENIAQGLKDTQAWARNRSQLLHIVRSDHHDVLVAQRVPATRGVKSYIAARKRNIGNRGALNGAGVGERAGAASGDTNKRTIPLIRITPLNRVDQPIRVRTTAGAHAVRTPGY